MGQAKQRGTREQRIAQARERDEQVPNLSRTCGSTSRDELLHRIIPIYQQMDAHLAQSPVVVDCQAGCSYCCYYHVPVTPAEALALAEYISTLPDAGRIAIQARLTATAARVAPLSQRVYITTNIPCAFLDAGRCSVYAARPIACRGFHSRDVAACQRAFDDPHCTDLHPYDLLANTFTYAPSTISRRRILKRVATPRNTKCTGPSRRPWRIRRHSRVGVPAP